MKNHRKYLTATAAVVAAIGSLTVAGQPAGVSAAPSAGRTCAYGAAYISDVLPGVTLAATPDAAFVVGKVVVDDSLYTGTAAWVAAGTPTGGTPDGVTYPHMLGYASGGQAATWTFAGCPDPVGTTYPDLTGSLPVVECIGTPSYTGAATMFRDVIGGNSAILAVAGPNPGDTIGWYAPPSTTPPAGSEYQRANAGDFDWPQYIRNPQTGTTAEYTGCSTSHLDLMPYMAAPPAGLTDITIIDPTGGEHTPVPTDPQYVADVGPYTIADSGLADGLFHTLNPAWLGTWTVRGVDAHGQTVTASTPITAGIYGEHKQSWVRLGLSLPASTTMPSVATEISDAMTTVGATISDSAAVTGLEAGRTAIVEIALHNLADDPTCTGTPLTTGEYTATSNGTTTGIAPYTVTDADAGDQLGYVERITYGTTTSAWSECGAVEETTTVAAPATTTTVAETTTTVVEDTTIPGPSTTLPEAPVTGSNSGPMLGIGAAFAGIGALTIGAARRRRHTI